MVSMNKFNVVKVEQASSNVALLTLSPQTDDDRLNFYAGQYASIGFKNGGRPTPMRCFSIVSSPNDTRTLQFAMRIQGSFTKMAARLAEGTEAFVQGPFGSFIIDPDYDKSVIMIAGGIGVTPFISMIKNALATSLTTPLTLLYGVRNQNDIAFYEEIVRLEAKSPNLRVVFFVSDGAVSPVNGVRFVSGKIDEQRLDKVTGGSYQGKTYFICGPKKFMQDLQNVIARKGVSPHRIVTESFTQATKLKFGGWSIPKLTYTLTGATLVMGFAFFMSLDLIRYIPKNTPSQSTQTNTESDEASEAIYGEDGTSTQKTSPTTTTTTSPSTTTQSQSTNNTYTAPVSRVS